MFGPVQQLCRHNDLPWNDAIAETLAHFVELIGEFRESMNLIGPLSEDAIIRELIADSIAPAAVRAPRGPVIDVGTGAGFPGIPLAILYDDLECRLVEPRKKRHTFLKIARTRLGLDNLRLERARLQQLTPSPQDYVISKAFKPPGEWIPLAEPWMARETDADPGTVICMTRPDKKETIETAAARVHLELEAFVADTADIGAPATEPPRSIAVLAPAANGG